MRQTLHSSPDVSCVMKTLTLPGVHQFCVRDREKLCDAISLSLT